MKVKLFMENMWEFFLCFHFVTYKVNIPMYAWEFFYVIYLFHTKLIFPWMQGDLNKSNVRNIFVGYKWKFTFQTKPLWGFATVYPRAWETLFKFCLKVTYGDFLHKMTCVSCDNGRFISMSLDNGNRSPRYSTFSCFKGQHRPSRCVVGSRFQRPLNEAVTFFLISLFIRNSIYT